MAPPGFHLTFVFAPEGPDAFLDVRPDPGVALFCTSADQPVTLVSGADLRQLVRSRLDPEIAEKSVKSLSEVAPRVHLCWAQSEAERSLVWLQTAHRLLPRLADEAASTPPCWFLRLDARDEYPKPVDMTPRELATLTDLEGVFGPYPLKRAARHAGAAITDALDLCRHHHLLVLEPNASACAYKDMGRCPAPCDGSQTMTVYRHRVAEAQAWLADPCTKRTEVEAEMKDAASSMDYERAGRHKTLLERTQPLADTPARAIAGGSWIVIAPGHASGSVTLMHARIGHACVLAHDVTPEEAGTVVQSPLPAPAARLSRDGADLLAWLGGLVTIPDDKRIGRRAVHVLRMPRDEQAIIDAARDVVKRAARSASVE